MGISSILGLPLIFVLSLLGMLAFISTGWVVLRYVTGRTIDLLILSRVLLGLLALGFIVRIVVVIGIGNQGVYSGDPYPELAAGIASGMGYIGPQGSPHFPNPGNPTAYFPPGWPIFLAGFFKAFGMSLSSILVATSIVGIGLVLVTWAVVRLILGDIWGLVGANVAVWHPAGILAPFSSGSDLLFALVGGLFLLTALKLLQAFHSENLRQQMMWALTYGFVGGFGSLVRPYGLIIFLTIWVLTTLSLRHKLSATFPPLLAALVAFSIVLGPWVIRNINSMSHPVIISTNGGVNLWIGNHTGSNLKYGGPPIPPGLSQDAINEMTEVERDRVYRRAALDWIKGNPAKFLTNGVKKVILVYATDLSPLSGVNSAQPSLFNRLSLIILTGILNGYYWAILGLAALGWVNLLRKRRWFLSTLLGSTPIIVGAIAFVFFAEGRFHWVMTPSLIPLMTLALFQWVQRRTPQFVD